jgi:uncharacterized membrane protein
MEDAFHEIAQRVALVIEAAAVLITAVGALETMVGLLRQPFSAVHGVRKQAWRRFGMWLLLALEFELAADIIRSVIAPTWQEIGELGAIAVIRTFLNYFLEKDLEHAEEAQES